MYSDETFVPGFTRTECKQTVRDGQDA